MNETKDYLVCGVEGDWHIYAQPNLAITPAVATFRGLNAKERAEAEAQRMRDALPKLRFEVKTWSDGYFVFDSQLDCFVSNPDRRIQREFPGLVQHICDWLNEQSS